MRGKNRVVRFHDGSGNLRRRGDGKRKFTFATVVNRKTFQQETSQTRSCTSSSGVEHKETLKTCAAISKLTDAIQDVVDDFLSNGVMSTGVVVGCVFLAVDDLLRMVESAVGSRANLVADGWLQIDIDSSRNALSRRGFTEKSAHGIVLGKTFRLFHRTIRVDTVLEAVELPALVSGLDTGLAQVN